MFSDTSSCEQQAPYTRNDVRPGAGDSWAARSDERCGALGKGGVRVAGQLVAHVVRRIHTGWRWSNSP